MDFKCGMLGHNTIYTPYYCLFREDKISNKNLPVSYYAIIPKKQPSWKKRNLQLPKKKEMRSKVVAKIKPC